MDTPGFESVLESCDVLANEEKAETEIDKNLVPTNAVERVEEKDWSIGSLSGSLHYKVTLLANPKAVPEVVSYAAITTPPAEHTSKAVLFVDDQGNMDKSLADAEEILTTLDLRRSRSSGKAVL